MTIALELLLTAAGMIFFIVVCAELIWTLQRLWSERD